MNDVLVTRTGTITTNFTEVDTSVETVLGLLIVRTKLRTIVLWTHRRISCPDSHILHFPLLFVSRVITITLNFYYIFENMTRHFYKNGSKIGPRWLIMLVVLVSLIDMGFHCGPKV